MLEEQLATSRRRVETVVELENELMKYRQQVEQLSAVSMIVLTCGFDEDESHVDMCFACLWMYLYL